jgi:hypothetical protein
MSLVSAACSAAVMHGDSAARGMRHHAAVLWAGEGGSRREAKPVTEGRSAHGDEAMGELGKDLEAASS